LGKKRRKTNMQNLKKKIWGKNENKCGKTKKTKKMRKQKKNTWRSYNTFLIRFRVFFNST
jgi:hypothetical protein